MVDFAKHLKDRKEGTASFTNFDCNERPTEYTLCFGKHKGESVMDIPRDYLEWLLTTDMSKRPGLDDIIKAELNRRFTTGDRAKMASLQRDKHRAPSRQSELTMELARLIVEAGVEQMKEAFSANLEFTAAYVFLRQQIALEEVQDGTLVF